jgi:maltooligosyltrehalose trehalohydrolase
VNRDLKKRNIGTIFSPDGTSFMLWSPEAKKIEIIINDNFSLFPEMDDEGYWHSFSDKIHAGDKYLISIDDSKTLPDPASLYQPEGVHGPSQVVDLNSFKWTDTDWKGMPQHNVFYELHTGIFSQTGDFEGIAGKLEYLKELGITAIEIMPVAQFSGNRNWGYDGVYPFAVQNSYGGPYALQKLVNTCHRNGLAVILDVVYNHFGPEGNYISEFGPYFTDDYKTPWGKAINFDGPYSDAVRMFYTENMLMWFRDFHIDALRLDAVHAIKDFSARHIMEEMRDKADELEHVTGKKFKLIAELDLNNTRYILPRECGGYGLDMQWVDEFHHALHSYVTGENNGYYYDFGDISQISKALNDAYVYDDVYSPHRKKTFGSKTDGIPGNRFVIFIQNHDHTGNRMLGERIGNLVDFETLKLLAGIMFVSPYVPLLFMGEEYNEQSHFRYFTSHSDKQLIENVRKGRKEEFAAFMNADDIQDPQSEDSFNISRPGFDLKGSGGLLFNYYRELIKLKLNHPVMKDYNRDEVNASQINDHAVLLTRKVNENLLIALMNFNKRKLAFQLPMDISRLKLLIDSAEKRWGGERENDHEIFSGNEITVFPSSLVILSDIF